MLTNPNNANAETQSKDVQKAARAIGQKIQIVHTVGRLPHGMGVARLAMSAEWSRQRQMLGLPVL